MSIIDKTSSAQDAWDATFEEMMADMLPLDGRQVIDLAQQGYLAPEIAERLGASTRAVDETLESQIPGGFRTVRSALVTRLRAWRRSDQAGDWSRAEQEFGIPRVHILRLVRAPQPLLPVLSDAESPGFLDAVLSGDHCANYRAQACAQAYAMGSTLQELGDRFAVTRERIRQILSRDTPWSSTAITTALRRLHEARSVEQKRAVRHWSELNPASPLENAAGTLGMSEDQVRQLLGRRRTRHLPMAPRAASRYGDEEILEDLRAYHRQTGRATAAGFTDWARERGVPGSQTASIRFGTWNDALRAAGVRHTPGAPRSSFTDEDLWAAVVAVVRAPDGGTTARAAEEWLASRPAAPSLALIRRRIDATWAEATTIALAVLRGESSRDPEWIEAVTAERNWNHVPEQVEDLQHVQDAVAALGPHLSSRRYGDWAREQQRPSAGTLMRRTGKQWSELLLEAGGARNRSRWGA